MTAIQRQAAFDASPLALARSDFRAALLLAAVVAVFLMLLMPATQLWDRDETLYARTAVEMLGSGNWLLPTFNGTTFAHKPPLIYWLMASSIAVFGNTEFAVRLPSAFGMAGACFFTFLIGARLFGPRAGLWSMAVLATSAMSVYLGAAAMLDAVLLLFVTIVVWSFVEIVHDRRKAILHLPLAALVLTAAMLTKGPVGPAVTGGTVLLTWFLLPREARPSLAALSGFVAAGLVATGLFLVWALPANTASGGVMWDAGVLVHIIGRALAPMEGHGGSGPLGYVATLPAYLPVIVIGLFPWTIALPAAISALARREIGTPRDRAVLWGWLLPTFVLFTLAATKLPHYVFPMFPALAVLIGATIEARRQGRVGVASEWWLKVGGWIYAAMVLAMLGAVVAAPTVLPGLSWPVAIAFVVPAAVAAWLVTTRQLTGRFEHAAVLLALTSPLAFAALWWTIVPPAESAVKLSRDIASEIRARNADGLPVYGADYMEPSLVYYLDLPAGEVVTPLPMSAEDRRMVVEGGPSFMVATGEALAALRAEYPAMAFDVLASWSALNLNAQGKGQQVSLVRLGD